MYTFSSKLKTFSFILMLLGALGISIGFMLAPKTIQDVETILKAEESAHHEGVHEAASNEATKSATDVKAFIWLVVVSIVANTNKPASITLLERL